MCGITGYINFSRQTGSDAMQATVRRMADTLAHRGPDDAGIWVDSEAGVALGHRRLAVVDLSPEGHQPMVSDDGRYIIVFNGEIYNFRELRTELAAGAPDGPARWHGHSDTEVMLAAIVAWGMEAAVKRFTGMFAFALWDRHERSLHLVRDRLGEKPLYYGWMGKTFLFGSELTALRVHDDFKSEIDRAALTLFLRHNCIPAPHSIYRGVSKLLPGTILTINGAGPAGQELRPKPYWRAAEAAVKGVADPFPGSEAEALARLNELLQASIGRQMLADVPLGAFLSGGIDSTPVVALIQAQSQRPVKPFPTGFSQNA